MVVDTLYGVNTPRNRAELPFDLSDAMAKALESLYKRHSTPSDFIPEELFHEIVKTLNFAVSDELNEEYPQLAELIRDNNEVFAAFKVHDQCSRMAQLLTDGEGNLRSFAEWRREAEPIANHHNKVWLRTEYDTAVKRAAQARMWRQFEEEKDVLPNLRWVPSTAATPGADHMIFWDTVLPIDDPFWGQHKPGDRWGCQCTIEATDDPVTERPTGGPKDDPAPGLDNNPAQDGRLFSESHPYYPGSCSTCPFNTGGAEPSAPTNLGKRCSTCSKCQEIIKSIKVTDKLVAKNLSEYNSFDSQWEKELFCKENGGYLVIHKDRIKKGDLNNNERAKFKKEHDMSVNLANAGYRVKLLKDGGSSIGDCDITVNDILADLKKTNSYNNVCKYASETFGKKQGKIVVFELESTQSKLISSLYNISINSNQKIIYYYSNNPKKIYEITKK